MKGFDCMNLDFSKLGEMVAAAMHNGGSIVRLSRQQNKEMFYGTSIHEAYMDEFARLENSSLENQVDDLIGGLWEHGKPWAGHYDYVKANPKTKDLFKSKSTTHRFPWGHKDRKY